MINKLSIILLIIVCGSSVVYAQGSPLDEPLTEQMNFFQDFIEGVHGFFKGLLTGDGNALKRMIEAFHESSEEFAEVFDDIRYRLSEVFEDAEGPLEIIQRMLEYAKGFLFEIFDRVVQLFMESTEFE